MSQNLLLSNGDDTFTSSSVANVSVVVALSDFNRDGNLDIVSWSLQNSPHTITTVLGNGDGTFGAAVSTNVTYSPTTVTVTDVNNDGTPDLLLGYYRAYTTFNGFSVLLGNGDGTFQTSQDYRSAQPLIALRVGDFDGDDKADIVAIDGDPQSTFRYGDRLEIYTGNGNGTFRPRMNLVGYLDAPTGVATADVNSDGTLDLISANFASSSATVFLGDGHARFQTRTSNWTDTGPFTVVTADVNGDGIADAITANDGLYTANAPGSVSVLIGRGDGSFNPHMDYATGNASFPSLVFGDVTGDGTPDIVAVVYHGKLAILAGIGDGTFKPATFLTVGTNPTSLALADLNGDGHNDIVVGDSGLQSSVSASVYVLLSSNDGTYQAPVNYPIYTTTVYTVRVALADVTNDGKLDLVTLAHQNPNNSSQMPYTVHILPGDGSGNFGASPEITYPLNAPPVALTIGDLNNDGKADIVTSTATNSVSNISVLLNMDSTFAAAVNYAANIGTLGLAVGDFTVDGKPDIVATSMSYSSAKSSVFPGNGDGTFGTRIDYASSGGTSSVALADFNGDGRLDAIATSNHYTVSSHIVDLVLSLPQGVHLDISSPTQVTAGMPFDVTVRMLDANNQVYSAYNTPIVLSFSNPNTYNSLRPIVVKPTNGVAVVHNQYLNAAGTYQSYATSAQFSVTGATIAVSHGTASKLVFSSQPYSGYNYAGIYLAPQLQVQARDAVNNSVPEYSGTVTLAIKQNTGTAGAHLTGTITATFKQGVATFTDVGIDTAGNNYQLIATSGALDSAETLPFLVAPAPHLAFTTEPTGEIANQSFTVRVTIQNDQNNPIGNYSGNVTLTLKPGTGTAGAQLLGSTTQSLSNGVALFSISVDRLGTDYVIIASMPQLAPIESTPFNAVIGPAYRMVFSQQPQYGIINRPLSPTPTISVLDVANNIVTNYAQPITLAIYNKPTGSNPQLLGTTTLTPVNGVAVFSDVAIDTTGYYFSLAATSGNLPQTSSSSFSITNPPTALVFSVQPGSAQAGNVFANQPVITVKNANGETATDYSGWVRLAIKSGTGAAQAYLSGSTSVYTTNGVATFTDLSVNKGGMGYVLTATAYSLPPIDSQLFTITSIPAASLAFTTQPVGAQAGASLAMQPVVTVKTANGDVATDYNDAVTLAIKNGAGTGGATLGGAVTVNAINGVATFSGLSINKPGLGYVLTATNGAFSADSQPFDVMPSGSYVQMALRVDTAATTADTYVATLTLRNLTEAAIPADAKLTFAFANLRFDPKATKTDGGSLSGGARWLSLSNSKGVAVLNTALAAGDSRTISLHIHLTGTSKRPPTLKATLIAGFGTFSSNMVQGTMTSGATQAFTITDPTKGKAGTKALLHFVSQAFANGESLMITVSPASAFANLPTAADKRGVVDIATLRGLAPGTYSVSVYGWYSGITVTGTVTLT